MGEKAVNLEDLLRRRRRLIALLVVGVCLYFARRWQPYPPNVVSVGTIGTLNSDGKPPLLLDTTGFWNRQFGDPVAQYQCVESWQPGQFLTRAPLWEYSSLSVNLLLRAPDSEMDSAIVDTIAGELDGTLTHEQVDEAYNSFIGKVWLHFWWPGLMSPVLAGAALGCIVIGSMRLVTVNLAIKNARSWVNGPPYFCPKCGYDIGRIHSPCPECGTAIDLDALTGVAPRGGET